MFYLSSAPELIVSPSTPLCWYWFFKMVLRTKCSFIIAEFKTTVVIMSKNFRDQLILTVQENSWLLEADCIFHFYRWLALSCLRTDQGKKTILWDRYWIRFKFTTDFLLNL